ncbi:carboxypeptidase-like regulatory domain-containing protein [Cellulomonas gilvus]|uniref:alpha-amylase n=1 Tax=Cellulomonas gilvus (strain ATCC 13127 / NRRL B-14078) TaxID=593907 RepID=F8A1M4_CELGA|nr:carboxypeptidase-like regulatory domain-containing protein [Cellulomonas gilvus]AEI10545.1 hypothetical protein Celgi_0011 [Cellulomonas gilvus ATCC 13127]
MRKTLAAAAAALIVVVGLLATPASAVPVPAGPVPAAGAPSAVHHAVTARLVTTGGAPVVLREVRMVSTPGSPGTYRGTRSTDGTGTARFPDVPDGTFVVTASVPSASGAVQVRRTVRVAGQDVRTTIEVAVDAALFGAVTRATRPVGSALVSARRVGATAWSPTATSAANGVWSMTGRSPGRYVVMVDGRERGYLTTYSGGTVRLPDAVPVRVRAGEAVRADVRTVAAATLVGRVLDDDGDPVARAYVHADNLGRFGSADAVTGSDGRFRLTGLATGRVRIEVLTGSFDLLATAVVDAKQGAVRTVPVLTARAGARPTPGDVWASPVRAGRAAAGATLTGRVEHAGDGVAGVQVVVATTSGSPVTTKVVTDADGSWTITGCPAGSWRVQVRDPYTGGYLDARRAVTVTGTTVPVGTIVVR